MDWLLKFGLALLALVPLVIVLWRPGSARGRGAADLALYRAQLAELDRERAAGRLDEAAHAAAVLEVQRRLLAAPATGSMPARPSRSAVFLPVLLPLVPAAALGLYLWHGKPGLPAATFAERAVVAAEDAQIVNDLRARLELLQPNSAAAREGLMLLGTAERARGDGAAAAEAWTRALTMRFDPTLAAELIELQIERQDFAAADTLLRRSLAQAPRDPRLRFLSGAVAARAGRAADARAAWTALLADTPPDAPWKPIVERAIAALP
ncbi:c-type cytochrome biogenesis protein CcmI [Humitalea sp. 24SJ18S-53]|uniref:c-type cytochrome biogenesis protein CcmI n=1 Tax=Humitalea sp. 24SJ18S-53 TaxID=3422307 RepID=UPI003D66BF6D